MSKKFRLYYSAKQAKSRSRDLPRSSRPFGILEDGRIVEYTQAVSFSPEKEAAFDERHGTKPHSGVWDDSVFLGEGEWHHNE